MKRFLIIFALLYKWVIGQVSGATTRAAGGNRVVTLAKVALPILLLACTVYLNDGREIFMQNCKVIKTGIVQNDKGVDVKMIYFGKYDSDGGVTEIGRTPIDNLKGVEIFNDNEVM